MPSLIDLRRRIRAVKSTQQITKAMKMIAASRLKRAQDRVIAARPFAQRMLNVLNGLVSNVDPESHPLLRMPPDQGRVLLIVPNRRGIWARLDTTPFGHGRPYSRGQLERLLTDALFSPLEWTSALFMPPIDRQWLVRWATAFERVGARLWPGFAGVIIVEARKELMGAIPKAVPARRVEELAPARGGLPRGKC